MTPFPSANHLAAKIKSKPQKQRSLKADILQPQIFLETQNLQVQASTLAFQIRKFFSLPMGAFTFLKIHRDVKSWLFKHWSKGDTGDFHFSYGRKCQICSRVRDSHDQGIYPGTALSSGMETHSSGARNHRMRIPQLKGKSQLNQIKSELNEHLNPLSEHRGAYLGQAEKAIMEGNL